MPRILYTPSTSPTPSAPSTLQLFIQQAQLDLVYLTLDAPRCPAPVTPDQAEAKLAKLRPTIYQDPPAA